MPAQPNALIGRADDLALARAQLTRPDVRLLTLTGAAGSGKTRLAVEIAATSSLDTVLFVDLTPVTDPSLVVATIAQVLGVVDTGSEPLLERLQRHVSDKRILFVLDNCEHVLDGMPAIARLLEACPYIRVLATSREPEAMSIDRAVAYALSDEDSAPAPNRPTRRESIESTGPLTRREQEVVRLVARGLTNLQIAYELVVSERTVENHISHILTKLGMQSRTQVATWATVLALVAPVTK